MDFQFFFAFSLNIWPLTGPNIAKKGWPLQKMARVDQQTHFGTFNFWVKPGQSCDQAESEILMIFCYFFGARPKITKNSRDQVGR